MSDVLTFALSKGRILKETLPLLEKAGIKPLEDVHKSRKLIFETTRDDVRIVILRATDVPTYVQLGSADLGIAGKDVLMEHGAEGVHELLDLDIARCRLMTAGLKGVKPPAGRRRVATKFVGIARRYYASVGVQADLIKLYGAMELAPIMGLADEIVDIVDTGNTLRANGLEPREEICFVSSRLIANAASMKTRHRLIRPIVDILEQAVRPKQEAS